jgi:hypothetical protein
MRLGTDRQRKQIAKGDSGHEAQLPATTTEQGRVPKLAIVAGLLILVCSMSPGCTAGESLSQPAPQSIQLQGVEVDIGGTLGPRHGPYGR